MRGLSIEARFATSSFDATNHDRTKRTRRIWRQMAIDSPVLELPEET
jgi:hypothetical protein